MSLDKEAIAVSFCKEKQKYPEFIIFLITEFRTALMEWWESVQKGSVHTHTHTHTHRYTHMHTGIRIAESDGASKDVLISNEKNVN